MNTALETTVEALPGVGAGLDTHVGPTFVQDRLRMLGKTVFLLSFGFYVAINGLYVASGAPPWPLLTMQHNVMHLIASSVMGVVWVVMRRRPWTMRALGGIDAASVLLAGTALAMMAAMPVPEPLMAGIMALSVTLLARAVLLPSTAKRTLVLSVLSALPLQITAVVFHGSQADPQAPAAELLRIVPAVSTFLWLMIAVTLSTVASRTIYGLRRQVKEAAEIGQYTLVDKIGSGGMGEVWRARHRMLIRPAAVKLIRPSAIGPAERELLLRRFEREAHATAGLKSPHTVQLYDFGVADDGTLYYVMELLEGMDLDVMVDRFGAMPAERAIHLLDQVTASLDDAHRNGLVHRDIKPANIVVSWLGAGWDFVKVLDFGLVKLEGARASDASVRLTADGSASGTPAFMAPEVALGEQEADHRVDIYSLGCVAYWLVTGTFVFDGPSAVKMMLAHAHTPPPPPSSRAELPIPPELEALILECLAKDPADRPASAAAIQARLRAIPLATPWTRERAESWWSAHAPHIANVRPVAEALLSQEARPLRVIRQGRSG